MPSLGSDMAGIERVDRGSETCGARRGQCRSTEAGVARDGRGAAVLGKPAGRELGERRTRQGLVDGVRRRGRRARGAACEGQREARAPGPRNGQAGQIEGGKGDEQDAGGEKGAWGDGDADEGDVVVDGEEGGHQGGNKERALWSGTRRDKMTGCLPGRRRRAVSTLMRVEKRSPTTR